MVEMDKAFEEKARTLFKYFNKGMVFLWKLGLADWINIWPSVLGQILVIKHTGRKTGYQRLTPVNYAVIDNEVYCCAGFGPVSDWYRNILINPSIEIWMTEGRWSGIAEDISTHPQRSGILREVLIGSGFAANLFGVNPKKIDDLELDQLTKDYRLIHIRRISEKTGRDGPGELAWVWPLIAVLLLLWKGKRRKK